MAQNPQPPEPLKAQASSQGGMVVPTQQGPQDHLREKSSGKVSEATKLEQKAGMEAVQKAKERLQQEQAQGKKIIQDT